MNDMFAGWLGFPPSSTDGTHSPPQNNTTEQPRQLRWGALPLPPAETRVDWVHGLSLMAGAGDPGMKEGLAVYMYVQKMVAIFVNPIDRPSDCACV